MKRISSWGQFQIRRKMNFKHFILAALFVVSSVALEASVQGESKYYNEFNVKENITLMKASRAFNSGFHENSLRLYREVHQNHKDNDFLNFKMGECYLNLNMLKDAGEHFSNVKAPENLDPYFYFNYGVYFHKIGDYTNALANYKSFTKGSEEKEIVRSEVKNLIAQCEYGLVAVKNELKVTIEALSDSVNSEYSDAAPSISADGKMMIYTTRRPENRGGDLANDGMYFEDIYFSNWNEKKECWGKAKTLEGSINSKEHDAATSISPDGNYIFVYRNIKDVTQSGDIFISKLGSTGRWSSPKPIEGVNSSFFESSACVTPDGNTMYFVSERIRGGLGKSDIWMSNKIGKNLWSKPVNIGDVVNTPEDEIGVFIHPDGKTLFFASQGHHEMNLGGYDIFKTVRQDDGSWSNPENLGYPINTYRDERHFVLTTDGSAGYFTAQRKEGRTDMDIYKVDFTTFNLMTGEEIEVKPVLKNIKGKIVDGLTKKAVEINVTATNEETGESFDLSTNENGEFFNTLTSGNTYKITAKKEGYLPYENTIVLEKEEEVSNEAISFNFELERVEKIEIVDMKLFEVQRIYFDVSSAKTELGADAKKELDLFIEQMKKAPKLTVELSGHTDASGNEDANLKLSLKRAKMVAKYFTDNGIDESRILSVGMGSSQPIADNDTPEGKAKNRRVEVKLSDL